MVKRVKFERGDIVRVSLNPTLRKEQQGDFRPALVLPPAAFNALGMALVAPITQGGEIARYAGFAVPRSGSGTETQDVALVNKIRTLDLEARGARKVERAPVEFVEDALARLQTILESRTISMPTLNDEWLEGFTQPECDLINEAVSILMARLR